LVDMGSDIPEPRIAANNSRLIKNRRVAERKEDERTETTITPEQICYSFHVLVMR
jgi:hypothetical protein